MRPAISEFSFGYAITEALCKRLKGSIVGAPIFPSLKEEGGEDGGFDLSLKRKIGFPLFLQFKLTDKMVRSDVIELKKLPGKIITPFYRLHLMPAKLSKQHELLLKLDDGKNHVYYVGPFFHEENEFNKFYSDETILDSSFFIRPRSIGKLPDDEKHHISIEYKAKQGFLFSNTPGKEVGVNSSDQLISEIEQAIMAEETDVEEQIKLACKKMIDILKSNTGKDIESFYSNEEPNFGLLQTISGIYFGALVLLITKEK